MTLDLESENVFQCTAGDPSSLMMGHDDSGTNEAIASVLTLAQDAVGSGRFEEAFIVIRVIK